MAAKPSSRPQDRRSPSGPYRSDPRTKIVAPGPSCGSLAFWGIDPGQSGCLCVLGPAEALFRDFTSPSALMTAITLLAEACPPGLVVLERIQKAPRDNIKTATTFLHNSGWWRGVLDALFPGRWIPVWPQTWMAFHKLPAKEHEKDKNRSLRFVREHYPDLAPKNNHNRADALLMALYARHLHQADPLKLDDLVKETQNRREA